MQLVCACGAISQGLNGDSDHGLLRKEQTRTRIGAALASAEQLIRWVENGDENRVFFGYKDGHTQQTEHPRESRLGFIVKPLDLDSLSSRYLSYSPARYSSSP